VHIEPLRKEMRIRIGIRGRLREVPSPQKKLFQSILSRIKILSGRDIAKTRVPQDADLISKRT
jgi:type IV pilus assembly protein PilB